MSLNSPQISADAASRGRGFSWWSLRSKAAALIAAVLVLGGAGVAMGEAAEAHTPAVSANCTTLSVTLTNYAVAAGKTNTVAVTINGQTQNFGFTTSSWSKSFAFANSTVNNSYKVAIVAWDAPKNPAYSPVVTGTTSGCAPAKNAAAAVATTPPSCTAAASAVPGTATNASWSGAKSATGPGTYRYVATASAGHVFSNGQSTMVFSGSLAGPTGYQSTDASAPCYKAPPSDAAAAVVVTPPGCTAPATVKAGDVTNATWSSVGSTSGPGSYTLTATAAAGHVFANGKAVQTFSGTLAGPKAAQSTDSTAPCYSASTIVTPPSSNQTPAPAPAAQTQTQAGPALADTGSDAMTPLALALALLGLGAAAFVTPRVLRSRRS